MSAADSPDQVSTKTLISLIEAYKNLKHKSLMQAKATRSYDLRIKFVQIVFECDATIKKLQKLNDQLKTFLPDETTSAKPARNPRK